MRVLVGLARTVRGVPLVLSCATALIAVVVVGCGSSSEDIASKSAAAILAASRSAAVSAGSVHVVSRVAEDKGKVSLASDFELSSSGGRAKLSYLNLGYEALRVGDTVYVKGNRVFYERLASRMGVHVPVGTWLKEPATGGQAGLVGLTSIGHELGLQLSTTGPLTKGAIVTIDGQKAIELKDAGKLYTGAIYIAATGKPYPIQIVKHGRESGQTTFSGWNDPVTLSAPAGAVELSSLEHHGRLR